MATASSLAAVHFDVYYHIHCERRPSRAQRLIPKSVTENPDKHPPTPSRVANLSLGYSDSSDGKRALVKTCLFAAALLVAVIFIYHPAWHGGFIWDDEEVITAHELQSLHGLYRIWFEIGATQQQYYPLVFSVFWIEHKLWGDTMLGYHLVNLVLHVVAALMLLRVLQRLAIPGAFLAAALFALHPVQVESVAWIVELKNVLSTVFYLGAALLYLRFDQSRKRGAYAGAWVFFVMSLFCKTATLTLPAALLVIFWWQRGRLDWRRDFLPFLPFFIVGFIFGLVTVWVEIKPLIDLPLAQRWLLPGRTSWFYLGKLFWPAELTPIYPRWNLNEAIGWQSLFTLGMVFLIAAFWAIRKMSRGPLAALLFFLGSLFPILGLFHPAYFDHSFVADHFVYVPSIGIFALFSAGVALWLQRVNGWRRSACLAGCVLLLAVLGVLSWRHSHSFNGVEAHSRATLANNPACFVAHSNLGSALTGRGKFEEAIAHFRKAIEIGPSVATFHVNLGAALYGNGEKENAVAEYRDALKIEPDHVHAHHSLGNLLAVLGRSEEAMLHFKRAAELRPDVAEYRNNLGVLLLAEGQVSVALEHFRKALESDPQYAEAHYSLGMALAKGGQTANAIASFKEALKLNPNHAKAHYDLALALNSSGQTEEAITHYQKALAVKSDYIEAMNNLSAIFFREGRLDDAIQWLRRALETKPDYQSAQRNITLVEAEREKLLKALASRRETIRTKPDDAALLKETAWILATNPNASVRNGTEAVELARRAVQLTDSKEPMILGTLAAAYAEAGRFPEAVETAQQAQSIASQQKLPALADLLQSRLRLFQAKSPFREAAKPSD